MLVGERVQWVCETYFNRNLDFRMKHLGVVAAGHPETVKAAEEVLRAGGNAFDAIVAAHFVACVVEPVLASLGGGG